MLLRLAMAALGVTFTGGGGDLILTGRIVQVGYVSAEESNGLLLYAEGMTGDDGWHREGAIPLDELDRAEFAFLRVESPDIAIARAP